MALKAIHRRSAEQLAADALREQITSGDLLPGSRLTEMALSDVLGVSRGTLRFALHQLTKEGLVVQTPYTGWSVATVASDDLWELYTLRADFESMATQLVCENIDAHRREVLQLAYHGLCDACEGGRYPHIAKKDFELHQTIVRLADHGRLASHYRLVEQQIRTFVATTYHFVDTPESVVAHHRPIVDAIMRGDGIEACELIEAHATSEGRKLHDYLVMQESKDQSF